MFTHLTQDFIDLVEKEIPQDSSTALEEKFILYSLIRALKPEVVVETGTHKGKTSVYLGQALIDNGKGHLHTCDPWHFDQIGNFRKIPGMNDVITYYQLPGIQLPVEEIDFAFIDGYHVPSEVEPEILYFLPKLKKGGVMVFHDTYPQTMVDPAYPLELEDVAASLEKLGLKAVQLNTACGMRIYCKE